MALKCLWKSETVPCRQLNVLRVVVGTQIEHRINELDPLHLQDLQVCNVRNSKMEFTSSNS